MLSTPFIAGSFGSSTSSATYSAPVSVPVPAGATVIVFAGASGATTATSVTDSQGNTYTAGPSSTANEYLQAFTCLNITTALNPLAGDTWIVTFSAANAQNKNIVAVAVTGAGAYDNAASANGNSTAPSVTQTVANGNDVLIACVQNANAGGFLSGFSLTALTPFAPAGQQYTSAGYGYVTRAGPATVSASITSAPWAVLTIGLTAAAPVALGTSHSPSGGALLPPYPVLPAPRTWAAEDKWWTPRLRADPGNAITLLANPPLTIAGQTITAQSVPSGTGTALTLDTDLTDTWGAHVIPNAAITPPLAGWYLAEGFVFLNDTSTTSVAAAQIQAVQNGTTNKVDGGKVANNGVNFPIPNVADLVQVNPATNDTIALGCFQDSGTARTVASAWIKTEWVCASSGTVVSSPVPAAGWTSGATTLLAAVSAGATSVLIADPTGIVTGGVIALDFGNAVTENVTVTSVSGQTIGISACTYPHLASAPVSVPVSAAWMNQQVRDKISFLAYRPVARLTNQGSTQANLASQTWPAGTAIQWANPATSGNRTVDNFGGWAGGSPTQYTFPVSGVWHLYGQAYLADAASSYVLSAGLAISGGTIQWGDRVKSAGSASEEVCATVRRVLRVAAGQWVEVYASQGSGGSLAWQIGANVCSRLIAVWRGF